MPPHSALPTSARTLPATGIPRSSVAGADCTIRVLDPAIRMMDHTRGRPPVPEGHIEGIQHQRRLHQHAHRPAHHSAAEHVHHDGQVQPASPGPHVRDVRDPEAFGVGVVNCRCTRSGTGAASRSRHVVRGGRRRCAPTRPAVRISRATRLRPHRTSSARSSACTRGAPYVRRLRMKILSICSRSAASACARADGGRSCQA
jgi:hypothetical protein